MTGAPAMAPLFRGPRYVVLADDAWQPEEAFYQQPVEGQDRPWGTGGTGQTLLRCAVDSPPHQTEEDAATWPSFRNPMLGVGLVKAAEACAKALRAGDGVSVVVGSDLAGKGAFFAALVIARLYGISGLDALEKLEKEQGAELVRNFSHRCFLRNIPLF